MYLTAGSLNDIEVDELRERVRELERMVGLRWVAPRVLGLTPTEQRLLGVIVAARAPTTISGVYNAIYSDRANPPEPAVVNVLVCKLRKKLAPHGLGINTRHAHGYFITPENLDRLNALYAPGERLEQAA